MSSKMCLKDLVMFIWKKWIFKGTEKSFYSYSSCPRLSSESVLIQYGLASKRTETNGEKKNNYRCLINLGKHFLTVIEILQWIRVPDELVAVVSLKIGKWDDTKMKYVMWVDQTHVCFQIWGYYF